MFLTSPDLDKMRTNPSAMEKVMGYVEYLPNVKNLSFSSIQDAVQTSLVTVKNEFSQFEDPPELRPNVVHQSDGASSSEQLDLAKKYMEIETSIGILTATVASLKRQRELH